MPIDPELDRLRAQMDLVNRRLVAVLHERARLCRAIGAHKAAHGLPALDPGREAAMVAAVTRDADGTGFPPEALARIFAAVLVEARSLVQGL